MENNKKNTSAPPVEDLRDWISNDPNIALTGAVWTIESNISFMDDGLAIMEELLAPVVSGSRNNLNLTELTDSQVKALYGGLTYLQMLHENVDKGIKELYKAINAKKGGQ